MKHRAPIRHLEVYGGLARHVIASVGEHIWERWSRDRHPAFGAYR